MQSICHEDTKKIMHGFLRIFVAKAVKSGAIKCYVA